ncbi:transcription initiation protein [Pseudonocardia sp. CNS-004]|nr:transcription initiation protein [Pseudonocardia sp. CNS-004]
MQYMLLICGYEGDEVAPEDRGGYTIEQWVAEMDARGVRLQGDRLRPQSDSTTVRFRGGEVLISDGPFAETKEQMYGYDLLECADLDEAIEVASKHPFARQGVLEIRPVWPLDQ